MPGVMLGEAPDGVPECDSLRSGMERYRSRVFLWTLLGVSVVFAVLTLHLLTAVAAGGPVAVPDIPAYLGIAQWVGGNGLAPDGIPFQPGYGLLISPLVAALEVSQFSVQGETVHRLALIVNSVIAAAAVLIAGRLSWMGSRRWWLAAAAGLIAATHPSLSSASRIAWPETLLGVAVLLVALGAASAVTAAGSAASQRAWARAGLFAAVTVAFHARMVVLVVAVVLTALLCRIGRRGWIALGAGLGGGSAVSAAALSLTGTWPAARLSEAAQLDRGFEPVVTFAGQLLALGAGTVGLGVIGLVAGLRLALERFWRQQETRSPDALTAGLMCVAFGALGALAAGSWTLTGSERADVLLYGRYVDPWAVPLAVLALAWLTTRHSGHSGHSTQHSTRHSSCRRTSAVLGTSAVAALISCVLVVVAADGYDAAPRRIMTLSFSPAWVWLNERLTAVAFAAFVFTLVGVLLAAVALRHKRVPMPRAVKAPYVATGMLVAAVLTLSAAATVSNHRHLADVGDVAREQVTAALSVTGAVDAGAVDAGLACLAHDQMLVPEYALWLYRLELPQISHERVRLETGDRPCSELVIADDDLTQRCANARHLVDEPAASWALWHLPERTCQPGQLQPRQFQPG